MHSFVIEQQPCGQCLNQRTVRYGALRFCFNCRLRPTPSAYPFTDSEQARLAIYRTATQAGFYTDT